MTQIDVFDHPMCCSRGVCGPQVDPAADYEIVVDTDEPDRRLDLLHDNVKKYGTVFDTVAPGTDLQGVLVRAK
jgi:hypothetical protein